MKPENNNPEIAPGNKPTARILSLRNKTMSAVRYVSIEQAAIITDTYRVSENKPVIIVRAESLARSLREIHITIDPEELIVGNRTSEIRAGVVFPEAGINWLEKELETLPERPQDPFEIKNEDVAYFREVIKPFWKGKSLEDDIYSSYGTEISAIEKVVKINQKDHAQGHICPNVSEWLRLGPTGLLAVVDEKLSSATDENRDFYKSASLSLKAARDFIIRYAGLAFEMAGETDDHEEKMNLIEISEVCNNIAGSPPGSFREALQSVWFLFVILHMESNASSFSPGRMDQYLYSFYRKDIEQGKLDNTKAMELLDSLFIKFNQIVYLRNSHSAKYFAGFPIGFNITVGGQTKSGEDATNELSYLILKTQDHIRLPQPNLTARLHHNSPGKFIDECTRVIGLGNGMPQIVNDESIIPSLRRAGVTEEDSYDYALVGCVELSTQGNFLGWSDAAMFNLPKVLELTINDGICMLSGKQLGLRTGTLEDHPDFKSFCNAFRTQIDYFTGKMISACEVVERSHKKHLPSPFLSAVVDNCVEKGVDVTAGGAKYNFSGIQAIQVANIADSMAVLKELVFEKKTIEKGKMLGALRNNFKDSEPLRQTCINRVPKFGNDVSWVDDLGAEYIKYFAEKLEGYTNYRGGKYHLGLYTVSAHVPMGQNVAATPDGRFAMAPLADGGMSPMYGRDSQGPTAVLNSVCRIPSILASNGTLLNLKFFPSFFSKLSDREKFSSLLETFITLPIHHVQFNVVSPGELIKAKADPDSYRGLTIRVAGYTAYFTELASDLQDEIINRTTHG
jgi:pyruvate formate-lyase/glycerol dehydratase family glycyl radical enzyme